MQRCVKICSLIRHEGQQLPWCTGVPHVVPDVLDVFFIIIIYVALF